MAQTTIQGSFLGDATVTGAKIGADFISAQTALTTGLATTDEIIVSDAGVIKRMDISVLRITADQITASGTLPALNGAALTALNGTQITSGTVPVARLSAASTTAAGIAELATTAEINTGNDTGRVITPKALADSALGERVIQMVVIDFATALTTGSKFYFHVPSTLNGFDIVHAHAETFGDPSGTNIQIMLVNVTQSNGGDAEILSGKLIIGIGYFGSDESGGSYTIDLGEDDLQTNDVIRVDIDQIGSGDPGTGLIVTLICRLP